MDPQTIAALVGVARHVEELEDEAQAALAAASGTAGLWALAGRQSIMRMRALVQQRLLKR